MTLILEPVKDVPLIQPGDDLARIIIECIGDMHFDIQDGDIIVVAQKVISKSEGRMVNLNDVIPSGDAMNYAFLTGKDPRFIELVLRESQSVLRTRPGTIIVEHKNGFICANAGIDHSNVQGPWGNAEDWVLLLPQNPAASAENLRKALEEYYRIELGVLIIDSHGRAWRNGVVGTTIGLSNVPAIIDMRGEPDMFGYQLRVTTIAAADELAAAASLVMGEASEQTPVILVRGFPYSLRESTFSELIRDKEQDLFR